MRSLIVLLGLAVASVAAAPSCRANGSLWNGSWTLDPTRSSAGAAGMAAPGYTFVVTQEGAITWRIPAIGEIATGRTTGEPMAVHRRKPAPGMMLSVRADGRLLFHYQVLKNGVVEAAGLMRLIEGGKAWVDISWLADKPEDAGELVYSRDPAR